MDMYIGKVRGKLTILNKDTMKIFAYFGRGEVFEDWEIVE